VPTLKTVNIKDGMPKLEEARQRLASALATAKREGCKALKIVHGYGSSGVGGVLRDGIRASLRKRRKKGEIAGFIPGENWSIFEEATRELIEKLPDLRRESDLDRGNEGITIVVL
jgi:hypothetical protein